MKEDVKTIGEAIAMFCILVRADATKERIDLTAAYLLRKFSVEQIKGALGVLADDFNKFPDVATITKTIRGDDKSKMAIAEASAAKILDAAQNYGEFQVLEAKQFLGPELWAITERFGGFCNLTKLTYGEIPTTRAQLRNFIAAGVKDNRLCLPEISGGKFEAKTIGHYLNLIDGGIA